MVTSNAAYIRKELPWLGPQQARELGTVVRMYDGHSSDAARFVCSIVKTGDVLAHTMKLNSKMVFTGLVATMQQLYDRHVQPKYHNRKFDADTVLTALQYLILARYDAKYSGLLKPA